MIIVLSPTACPRRARAASGARSTLSADLMLMDQTYFIRATPLLCLTSRITRAARCARTSRSAASLISFGNPGSPARGWANMRTDINFNFNYSFDSTTSTALITAFITVVTYSSCSRGLTALRRLNALIITVIITGRGASALTRLLSYCGRAGPGRWSRFIPR